MPNREPFTEGQLHQDMNDGTYHRVSQQRGSMKILAWIVILVGAVILVMGVYYAVGIGQRLIDEKLFSDRCVQVQALAVTGTVGSTEPAKSYVGISNYRKYSAQLDVQYEYQGKTYEKDVYRLDETYSKGDTLTVYIDPEHPEDCRNIAKSDVSFFELLQEVIILVIGFGALISGLRTKKYFT